MSIMRWIFKGLIALAVLVAVIVAGALWMYRDISDDTLKAKYEAPNSQYITLDGVRIHYRDEGPRDGPVVVLNHAHWASIIMWDEWADALKDKYRVVRYDMAGHGLTSIDPTGDYTLERGVFLMESFFEALDIDKFDLIGTSLGGTHAIHYTVKHSDQIQRLVLMNPGALNAGVRGRDTPRGLPWWIDILTYITPKQFFQFMLEGGYGDPSTVEDVVVTRWHDMQMGEGKRPAELERTRQYVSGDIIGLIKSIPVPTLIMWGEENPVVTVDQAYEFIELLENTPEKQLSIYPGLGHMAAIEDPITTANDIRAYLDRSKTFSDHLTQGS